MTKFFGLADIAAGLLFIAGFYQLDVPRGLMMTLGIYLMFKGLIFIVNFFSWLDMAAGALLTFGLFNFVPPWLLIGLAVFLVLKGIVSLFSFS